MNPANQHNTKSYSRLLHRMWKHRYEYIAAKQWIFDNYHLLGCYIEENGEYNINKVVFQSEEDFLVFKLKFPNLVD